MTPIEIMATILAVLILVKMLFLAFKPEGWMKFGDFVMEGGAITQIIYLALIGVSGYYILQSLTIIDVAAVVLLTVLLLGLGFMPYYKSLAKLKKEVMKDMWSKNWLTVLIWVVFSIWVLYALFV